MPSTNIQKSCHRSTYKQSQSWRGRQIPGAQWPGSLTQPNQPAPGFQRDPISKSKMESDSERNLTLASYLHTYAHTCPCPHMSICTPKSIYICKHACFSIKFKPVLQNVRMCSVYIFLALQEEEYAVRQLLDITEKEMRLKTKKQNARGS